jgi:hypothetical protein
VASVPEVPAPAKLADAESSSSMSCELSICLRSDPAIVEFMVQSSVVGRIEIPTNEDSKTDRFYSQRPAALSYSWLRKAVITMQL